jgi:hypothetical protein
MNTQPPSNNRDTAFDLRKVKETYAQEITQRFELQSESLPLLTSQHTPSEFLQILIENNHNHDAVTFLAHAIPARKAIWWTSLCTRDHLNDSDQSYQQAYNAAQNWLNNPTEENRRTAEIRAEESEYNNAASWSAAAAFWSGGSIAPVGEPVMEPAEYLYAHAITSAIIMSSGVGHPAEKDVKTRYQTYLKYGISIANGSNNPINDNSNPPN